ncbi:MAG: chloride channel protein, partial [Thermacetogeniaceae bacterium]
QIGAAIGSAVGQALRLSERGIITLVSCGVAAGISGIFGAPFAGVLYAVEVVMEGRGSGIFSYAFVSAVVADLVVWSLKGSAPVFAVTPCSLAHPLELLLYALLGAAAAAVAWLFMKAFYGTEDLFKRLAFLPEWLLPALGGVAFGIFGAVLPQSLGRGEGVVAQILDGRLNSASMLAALCLAKIVTTSVTLGSGGSGGLLFPALFIGAALGGSLGSAFCSLLPGVASGSSAYAVAGMAALFAALNHAPATAVLLVAEITRDYSLLIPIMLSSGVAVLLARALSRENIDTMKLARRGVYLHSDSDEREGFSASASKIAFELRPAAGASKVFDSIRKEGERFQ